MATYEYDVFLSFRGEDTRKSFTDHLYTALDREGIFTFRDDEDLERGQPISSNLLQAIQDSRIALVVFSRNYASSTWCLDELNKIVECMNETGQVVIPIFYHVDPSDVRKQTGKFGDAFRLHIEKFLDMNSSSVQTWRASLSQVANLSGLHLQERYESKFIQDIIEAIVRELNGKFSSLSNDLVGIDSRVEEIMKLCSSTEKKNDVIFIGILGMGGIGKTTLARAFYNKISHQFQARSFLENVREVSKRDGIVALQKKILSDVQMKTDVEKRDVYRGMSEISHRLCHKKVLIILDDVDELEQLQSLTGTRRCNWFGQGSRIIITTRDEQLLITHGVDRIYKAKKLNDHEGLELFSLKAFKNGHPPKDYMEISLHFVNYAQGLPLAIEVLGPLLYGQSLQEWESAFSRLKENLEGKIMSVLLIGFDGLHEKEKQIFLDIACFFKGQDKHQVSKILESFGFHPTVGISGLIRKSLITVKGGKLWMHDLLQEMGLELVRRECLNDPGNCSRLWHSVDVLDVLMNNKGTDAIQGIVLNLPQEGKLQLNCDAFSKMKKLRFLKISNVLLPQGLDSLSTDLKVVDWHGYPSELLPENFPSNKLVQLKMCGSQVKHLWKGVKVLHMLKSIELNDAESLTETPNFTEVPNLERLILEGCTNLSKVHPSISKLKHLVLLNMKNCKSLEVISHDMSLKSLEVFSLSGCARLKKFPRTEGDMDCLSKLYLDGTAIKELPKSIKRLRGLTLLDLTNCKNLTALPNVISSLTMLKKIILSGCSTLDEIPDKIGEVECLEELDISGTAMRQLPRSIVYLKNLRVLSCSMCLGQLGLHLLSPSSFPGFSTLIELDLRYCNLYDGEIPNDLDHLSSLKKLYLCGNNFTSIPESVCRLSKLEDLTTTNCSKLQSFPKLPSSVRKVWVDDCVSLNYEFDEYEVWDANVEGQLAIINRSISPMCYIQMSNLQFAAWLLRYHEITQEASRTAHGISVGAGEIPVWFNSLTYTKFPNMFDNPGRISVVIVPLPTQLYDKRRPWLGYALYVDLFVHESFDIGRGFKVAHKFVCDFVTQNGARHEQTLYHEVNVTHIPWIGPHGYWICIPHRWFLERLDALREFRSIEDDTITDSPHVEVKMSATRLLYLQDFVMFVHVIKSHARGVRIRKKKENLDSKNSGFSTTLSTMSSEDRRCKIDSTIPLKEQLESLPLDLQCYESRGMEGDASYFIRGKLTHPLTASLLGEILQEYSGQHPLSYQETFPQCKIPDWFYTVKGSSSTLLLNPSLESMEGWKGIAVCAAFTLHRHPFLILDNLDTNNSQRIECHLGNRNWTCGMTANITEILTCAEGRGFIWILYAARDSILDSILNECNSMTVTFFSNNQDMTVHSCGNQVVFDQNMDELMETIMQCSTTTPESWSSENITRQQSLDDREHHHSSHHTDEVDRNVGGDDDDDDDDDYDDDSDDDCYMMQGNITDPQTASTVGEILKKYSRKRHLYYDVTFPQCEIPEWFRSVDDYRAIFPLNPILESMKDWKGIAVCAAFRVHSHPSFLLDDYSLENPHIIVCQFEDNNEAHIIPHDITETLIWLKGDDFIWISYASRGVFSKFILNESNPMRIKFYCRNQDISVRRCGHRVVLDQNVEELIETIMQCSATSQSQPPEVSLDGHDHGAGIRCDLQGWPWPPKILGNFPLIIPVFVIALMLMF